MKTYISKVVVLSLAFVFFQATANAGTVIIGHPSNNAQLTKKEATKMYLGKAKKFPGGAKAAPVDQALGTDSRKDFYGKTVGKSDSQMKAHWSRLLFSGKGKPPKVLDNDEAVKQWVASHPEALGYINSSAVDASVKVLYTVE